MHMPGIPRIQNSVQLALRSGKSYTNTKYTIKNIINISQY